MRLNKNFLVLVLFGLFVFSSCSDNYDVRCTDCNETKSFCIENDGLYSSYDLANSILTPCYSKCNDSNTDDISVGKGKCSDFCDNIFECTKQLNKCNNNSCKSNITLCKNGHLFKLNTDENNNFTNELIYTIDCPDKTCNNEGTACFSCSQCPLGCNNYGTDCAMCNANKCENGNLRRCKDDQSGYEEETIQCPLGCNTEGTACAICTNKCENGTLNLCKDDQSGYKDESIQCPLGCNPDGNACKQCETNKCENGSFRKCKDDQSGYEDPITCLTSCTLEGCDQSCTTDICIGAQLYRCNAGTLSSQPDDCPEVAGTKGSCANGTMCQQCNESLNRRCVSPTEYNLCVSGLWSEEKHSCPDDQYCNDSVEGCSAEMKNSCVNNASGTGQIWTYVNGVLKAEECPHEASCDPNGQSCGECLIQEDTKCENGDYYICNNGKYKESTCAQGLGCHTDASQEHKKGVCNECEQNKCEKSSGSSVVGVLTRCINNMWDEDSETCEADGGKYVSCQSDTQCGVCKNNEIRCKDENTMQICKNGLWVNDKCDGVNQICDTKTNKCVDNTNTCENLGEKRCKPGDKDTPQTIIEECKESKGKRYWETIKTCSDNTPLCLPSPLDNRPSCVQCDISAQIINTYNAYNGYRCDPNNDRKRQSCQFNQWKEFQLVDQDCSSSEVCKENSTVARNDKGEYLTLWNAICVKRN